MNTYEIQTLHEEGNVEINSNFIKTDATQEQVKTAITFIKAGAEPNIEKLLQALRTLGFKATQIKLEPVATFEI